MQLQRSKTIDARGRLRGTMFVAAVFISMVCAAVHAQPRTDEPLVARREAANWLNRIHQAAQQQSYEGIFVYQRGSAVQSSSIVHFADHGDGEYERLESLDGKPRRMLRHNDEVYTFVPERKLCVFEPRQNRDAFPALLSASSDHVLSVYDPQLLGTDRVAGLDATVIELRPKDALRYTYKLWADQKTGLLLREQTLDSDGQVLEQVAFSQVRLGVPAGRNAIAQAVRNASGCVRPPVEPVNMEAAGWQLPNQIPGFRKVRELRRPMAARDPSSSPIAVDQAVFSDGLCAVSIFVEPFERNSRKEGSGASAATHILVKRHGDYWITALGEVPMTTLQRFTSAIEYRAPR
ncbi:MucB/RseB C-terminal domain-containing protein [Mycetohabitans sp. B2]|uniref:MucB/RseB C-terminal domain-containing protein n=1 Tax=Mycetohabitans sp. B2 TaxID=2841274 RepID=UPI003FA52BD6|nr:MucB/RseB C-terminal domain-containing protein [Mycetohabitans sp. B2]